MTRIRPATRADFIEFFKTVPPTTLHAIVAEEDGRLLGIGGYYIVPSIGAMVFTNYRDEMRKRDRVVGARQVVEMAKKTGLPVVAKEGGHGNTGLRHFGFEKIGGELYRMAS